MIFIGFVAIQETLELVELVLVDARLAKVLPACITASGGRFMKQVVQPLPFRRIHELLTV